MMSNILTPQEVITVARCLTHFQSDITDYELRHYNDLNNEQRSEIERALSALATTAGNLYAYSVPLEFAEAELQIRKMQKAATALKKFLQTVQKIRQVLDVVSLVADLADAIVGGDVESVTSDVDNIIRMITKD
jgi:hypothetical protein